jgi:magnesium transporter
MIKVFLEKGNNDSPFTWLDICDPTLDELNEVAEKYGLHQSSVLDCLDSEHLPKYEVYDGIMFFILRVYDIQATFNSDSINEISRKLAVFVGEDFILTVHRSKQVFLQLVKDKCISQQLSVFDTAGLIFSNSLYSFEEPLEEINKVIDMYEERMFIRSRFPKQLQQFYILKRKASTIKKILFLSQEVSIRLSGHLDSIAKQELRDNFLHIETEADQTIEAVNSLLHIYISLSSQKTNDIMQVLTIISVFFMPLTFIVGVYGMNFTNIPELEIPYGYYIIWTLMIIITIIIYVWFRRKKWL